MSNEAGDRPGWRSRMYSQVRGSLRLAGLILVSGLMGALIYRAAAPPPPSLSPAEIEAMVGSLMASATAPPSYASSAFEAIAPSLVLIEAYGTNPAEPENRGIGSGVVINDAAFVLTASHVIFGATSIVLHYADGSVAEGVIVSTEPNLDIGVVRPRSNPQLIVPAALGNLTSMNIGDEVFTVGSPLGLPGSLSAGVISGFGRKLVAQDGAIVLEDLIQFDAAVNPGNSGGPLLDRQGRVIGIVTGLANPTDQQYFIGISFAVPIAVAAGVAGAPAY